MSDSNVCGGEGLEMKLYGRAQFKNGPRVMYLCDATRVCSPSITVSENERNLSKFLIPVTELLALHLVSDFQSMWRKVQEQNFPLRFILVRLGKHLFPKHKWHARMQVNSLRLILGTT